MNESLRLSTSLSEMDWFWTASGKLIGYRQGEALFSSDGTHIGQFKGDEVYGPTGAYLGEIATDGRLITKLSKLNWKRDGAAPLEGEAFPPPHDVAAHRLTAGLRDFKVPGRASQ